MSRTFTEEQGGQLRGVSVRTDEKLGQSLQMCSDDNQDRDVRTVVDRVDPMTY